MSTSLQSSKFDQMVSLRDSYRIMEKFIQSYLSRGDTSVSDFLHVYADSAPNGLTTDPASSNDYLAAFMAVVHTESTQ